MEEQSSILIQKKIILGMTFLFLFASYIYAKYDFNISLHANKTSFTIRPHLLGTSYVVLLKITENNKDSYKIPNLPMGDSIYRSLIISIIETYENCIENNYFL